jgi:hypothetical protein
MGSSSAYRMMREDLLDALPNLNGERLARLCNLAQFPTTRLLGLSAVK